MSTTSPPAFEPYLPENTALFNVLYGPNLISLGGTNAIENLFSDLNINGLHALDIGFGLGGVAFYLAKHHQMKISGVEIHPSMVTYARTHAPKDLTVNLDFRTYDSNGKLPFAHNFFDIAYSKGVLNHVHDKTQLFKDTYLALKPNRLFVIADWIFPENSKETRVVLATETKISYERFLNEAGFKEVTFRNDSDIFLNYVRDFLDNLKKNRDFIEKQFSTALFLLIEKEHLELIEAIIQKHKQAIRIIAKK